MSSADRHRVIASRPHTDHAPAFADRRTWRASVALVVLVLAAAHAAGRLDLAVYTLSFWHYYLYALAYRYGAVPLAVFKRDAVTMKTVALAALAATYLAAVPDAVSVVVVAGGFLLNATAAAVLGADRTYYGHEVANLPPQRVTAFPYSLVAHPMLIGNVVAYGGTLLDARFRGEWWPLACLHVALNLGLLGMELYVRPQRRSTGRAPSGAAWPRARGCSWRGPITAAACGAAAGAAAGASEAWRIGPLPLAVVGATMFAYAWVVYRHYSTPASARASADAHPTEKAQ